MAKAKPKAKGKVGRPSLYSDRLAENICARIADGESLRTICVDEGYPDRGTVLRWLEQHADFASIYARAREAQADAMDEEILEAARACTAESAAADRVKIAAFQWRAERLKPKAYGSKVGLEASGSIAVTIATGVPSDD
jgi:hypothetical protein